MNTAQDTAKPLEGLLVADLSRVLAGPYCSMLLADMGATVIKVESSAGDDTRTWVPPTKDGVATYYMSINRNKKSIVLDFGKPDDLALVKKLVSKADICLENFKVGGLKKFGLDYESVSQDNPSLVYLSISGFGTAEGAWLPGYDLIVPTGNAVESLIRSRQLRPIDKARLPNLKHIKPAFLDTPFDPGNRYSVPYAYTLTLIGYNTARVRELDLPTDTWALIFEPRYLKRIKGRVTVLADAALLELPEPLDDSEDQLGALTGLAFD